jgi:hypothetical protein
MNLPQLFLAAESHSLASHAVWDGAVGAALGLLLVVGLVACDLDLQESMAQGGAPVLSLAGLVGVAVAQGALVASLGGALLRRFAALD